MNNTANKRGARTTRKQFELLINFAESNKEIVYQDRAHPLSSNNYKKKWEEVAEILNSSGLGPTKTVEQWQKAFLELKNNTKKKGRQIRENLLRTGGGEQEIKHLLPYEERLLGLMKKVAVEGANLPEVGIQLIQDNNSATGDSNKEPNTTNDAYVELTHEIEQSALILFPTQDCAVKTGATGGASSLIETENVAVKKKKKSRQGVHKVPRVTKLQKSLDQVSTLLLNQTNAQNNLNDSIQALTNSNVLLASAVGCLSEKLNLFKK